LADDAIYQTTFRIGEILREYGDRN